MTLADAFRSHCWHLMHVNHWTMRELSRQIGVCHSNFHRVMTTQREPSLRMLQSLASAASRPLSDLIRELERTP